MLPGRPLQAHGLGAAQRAGGVPFADAQPDALVQAPGPSIGAGLCLGARFGVRVAPSSTANSTRQPSDATRCTCDAMGTVRPPPNSSGSKNREYWRGRPDSGSASTDPACQKTPASASDSRDR